MFRIVDIIIPTYQPGEEFKALIRRLRQQDYPVRSIRVVNTLSESFPDAFAEKERLAVTHIPRHQFDHAGTRRHEFEKSDAEIVVFMTQDAIPADRKLIRNLVAYFDQEAVAAAYARQLPKKDADPIEVFTRTFNYPGTSEIKTKDDLPEKGVKTFFCSDVCAAYRKSDVEMAGGFPERAIFNEDMVLAANLIRAGKAVAYAADARVFHSHQYTGRQQFHRNFDLGVSQAEHPEIFKEYRSEGEGVRMVLKTAGYLLRKGKPYLLPRLVWISALKYIGYRLGLQYRHLPQFLVGKCTQNTSYWENEGNFTYK